MTNDVTQKPVSQRNKKQLFGLTLVFIVIGVAWAAMYYGVWAHEEESENAYVNGHLVQVTAQVHGRVNQILVDDTDQVKAGDVLLTLDDNDAKLALEKAKSQLIQAVRQNARLHSGVDAAVAQTNAQQADVQRAQIALNKALSDLKRREGLGSGDAISAEELAHAKLAVDNARAVLNTAKATVEAAKAQEQVQRDILGKSVSLEEQPEIIAAASQLKEAWLALERTKIRAPIDGQIAKRAVQLGQQIGAGSPLMVVVPMNDLWVDVNFKETQLARLKVGQKVQLHSDFYGKDIKFVGTIKGFSAGTGSAFSLLPAQNATGNWIKVVQRVPVRVMLDKQELAAHPLRIGLSMHAVVDVRDQSGEAIKTVVNQPVSVATDDLAEAEKMVADILAANR